MMNIHPEEAAASAETERRCLEPYKRTLTRAYGCHSLAFLGLSPSNEHFLAPKAAGLVNYRVVNHVAVVLGDPACAPESVEQVMRSFLAFCARSRWQVALYQVGPDFLEIYRALKLHIFKMGEEALLPVQTFTLQGSAMANVRTSCRRAEREGIRIQWYDGVPPDSIMDQLQHVSNAWLEHKGVEQDAETGFSTGRFEDLRTNAHDADELARSAPTARPFANAPLSAPGMVTGVALTSEGSACAFVTFTPIYGNTTAHTAESSEPSGAQAWKQGWGWSLDLMRRVPDAAPGVMELLLVRALEHFREAGASVVSLGLAAWADRNQETTAAQQQLVRVVTERLGLFGNHHTLFSFKEKFHPCWESRYLVTNASLTLPKVALAVLRIRNYSRGKGMQAKESKRDEQGSAVSTTHHSLPWNEWHHTFWQLMRYCLIGGINTLIDVCVLNILLWCFPTRLVPVLVGYNSLAYMSGAVSSFLGNKYWTFRRTHPPTRREVGRFVVTLFLEILVSNALIWLSGKALQPVLPNVTLWGNASKLVAVIGGTAISYSCMRFWTFAHRSDTSPHLHQAGKKLQ